VYSLGVVLFELLTGEVPFPGENFVAVALKHINEPPPSLLEKRPDVPVRLVYAIERALAKDPADRFPSMEALAAELRACLVEVGEPDAAKTFIQPAAVLKQSRPHRARAGRRSRWPILLLVLLAVAAAVAAILALRGSNSGNSSQGSTGGTSSGATVTLSATRAFDPSGDGAEHDSYAARATDGDPSTYWDTEHYRSGLGKPGVGLVLDAGTAKKVGSITVHSSTPGFTAEILAGSTIGSTPPNIDSGSQTVNGTTTFDLKGATARYYIVWITNLGSNSSVRIEEVTAKS
jgi:serine/threonine-protein kinase